MGLRFVGAFELCEEPFVVILSRHSRLGPEKHPGWAFLIVTHSPVHFVSYVLEHNSCPALSFLLGRSY